MKSYITTKEELNRISVKELHNMFNHASHIAFSDSSYEPEKANAKNSMEQIKRELISRKV